MRFKVYAAVVLVLLFLNVALDLYVACGPSSIPAATMEEMAEMRNSAQDY